MTLPASLQVVKRQVTGATIEGVFASLARRGHVATQDGKTMDAVCTRRSLQGGGGETKRSRASLRSAGTDLNKTVGHLQFEAREETHAEQAIDTGAIAPLIVCLHDGWDVVRL